MKDQLKTIRAGVAEFAEGDGQKGLGTILGAVAQLEGMVGEPYGTVTVVRNPLCRDMHYFYRHPEPPYLDNAAECHTVYTAAPVAQQPQAEAVPPGYVLLPMEPTLEMLLSARDWSATKYGKPIGDDAAKGCWGAMISAAIAQQKGRL